MKKKVRPVPKFRKEQDERDFWNTHDTTEYFDFSKSNRVEIEFDPGIEARVKSISLRLPREMLNELKVLANKKDILINPSSRFTWRKKSPKNEKPASGPVFRDCDNSLSCSGYKQRSSSGKVIVKIVISDPRLPKT